MAGLAPFIHMKGKGFQTQGCLLRRAVQSQGKEQEKFAVSAFSFSLVSNIRCYVNHNSSSRIVATEITINQLQKATLLEQLTFSDEDNSQASKVLGKVQTKQISQ